MTNRREWGRPYPVTLLYFGKDVASGAMVGYIQSKAPYDILDDVNSAADDSGIPRIPRSESATPLHEFDHDDARTFRINPFRLIHLWVETPRP